MPVKHGWRVWLCCEGREQSPGLLLGFHCVASSPAAPSSRFVCGAPNGAGSYKRTSLVFCTLLYECLALFSAPPRCQAAEYPLSDRFKANANTTPYYGRWRAFQWYCTGQGAGRRAGEGLRRDGMTRKQKGSLPLSGARGSERMEVCTGPSGVTRIFEGILEGSAHHFDSRFQFATTSLVLKTIAHAQSFKMVHSVWPSGNQLPWWGHKW